MRILVILFSIVVSSANTFSQDTTLSNSKDTSLLKMLDDSLAEPPDLSYVKGTFNGTLLLNMQSVEQPAKNVLEFLIMHRFGRLNDGAYNLFGLDNATIRLGLNYGITSRLTVGVARSSLDKTFDGS